MLNVRDTIVAGKRRCLFLTAALAIVEEQQQRMEETEEKKEMQPNHEERHEESMDQGMTIRHKFGQYNSLLTKLHKEDQK